MLKTSALAAVVLMLGLPACALAKPAESPRSEGESYSQSLPFTRARDSLNQSGGKQPCEGNSVKEFLQGTCDKLKGFDSLRDVRLQSSPGNSSIPPFYEFSPIRRIQRGSFVKEAGGHAWHIYGDDGVNRTSPLFEYTPRIYHRDSEFNKRSVDDFMQGKKDNLKGVDPVPHDLRKRLPPAWGGDEFVHTEGFTQSGTPYQQVNPLYGLDGLAPSVQMKNPLFDPIPWDQFELRPPNGQVQPKN